jgi:methyl-accepting chemotaxis protein
MIDEAAFAPYRRRAVRLLVSVMWLNWLALLPVGLVLGSDRTPIAMLIGLAALALPPIGWRRGRIDGELRLMLGIAAAVFPALHVAMLQGSAWQMDMHMYFFVCMTMLLLLLDWRPIIACTLLVAMHHLLLVYVLPELVFPGSGSLARVLLHALLVGGQASILIFATQQLRMLILRSEQARTVTEQARTEAEDAKAQALTALESLRSAQALGEQRVRERDAAEAALADTTRERRTAIASDIHTRIGSLAAELQSVAATLSNQEDALEGVSRRLTSEAEALRFSSDKSLGNVISVGASAEQLMHSAAEADGNVRRATALVGETAGTVRALEPRMKTLSQEIEGARGILDLVSAIAAQSNLLALNATIEAARHGDTGLGFGVVAHEMKQMAQRTAAATVQIAEKLDLISAAADTFAEAIDTTTSRMAAAGDSTHAVTIAVEQQRDAIAAIARVADAVKRDVHDTDVRSRGIGEAVGENRAIAARASDLARLLDTRARALGETMDRLIEELRAA